MGMIQAPKQLIAFQVKCDTIIYVCDGQNLRDVFKELWYDLLKRLEDDLYDQLTWMLSYNQIRCNGSSHSNT